MKSLDEFPLEILFPAAFPRLLREINDPPEKLWIRGRLPPDDMKFLSVVGSRKFSSYGKEACEKLIAGLRGQPIVIVSGLALGIDGIAHRAALEAGLLTLAVPGSGLDPDALYPHNHRKLADEILSAGGCLLSEFPPTYPSLPKNFPQRNRIMAGLSHAVLLIEASLKSGTMITGRLAAEYNRDVMVVPGSIFAPKSAGPHLYLSKGAIPITSSADILDALDLSVEPQSGISPAAASLFAACSDEELLILKLLDEPLSKDELIRRSGKPPGEIATTLMLLEIKGFIAESQGEIRTII